MSKITEIFGSKVFNDHVMRARLPKDTYEALKKVAEDVSFFAKKEGLTAHAKSAVLRIED